MSAHAARRPTTPTKSQLRAIARAAIASLHAELVLSPKPGLVCPNDRGSHADMDATTMMRSIVALRRPMHEIVMAAADGADFAALSAIGIAGERAMRIATGNVNTHRGAIFGLGILAAAAACCVADGLVRSPSNLRRAVVERWGRSIIEAGGRAATHGGAMAALHGAGGARREAAEGFPTVFDVVLPALVGARTDGFDARRARVHALMVAIAGTVDTNLLYRGGPDGLRFARDAARAFLDHGGVSRDDWPQALGTIGRAFVERNLSPGGSADLLAATIFVDRVA